MNKRFVDESPLFGNCDCETVAGTSPPNADAEAIAEAPGKGEIPEETIGRRRRFIEVDSDYRNIEVFQHGSWCSLGFEDCVSTQTRIDLDEPDRLVFGYARKSFAGLLLTPEPKSILVVGLGGGSISRTFSDLLPDASIDVVELDPTMVGVAKKYFMFEETANMRVYVDDARAFVRRAKFQGRQYDYIMLDAFDDEIIPPHLRAAEFLEEVKRIVSPGGVLVANTLPRFCRPELVTYQQVWGKFYQLYSGGNCIIIARLGALPTQSDLVREARRLAPHVKKYGIPLLEYPAQMLAQIDWNETSGLYETTEIAEFEMIVTSESDLADW